MIGADSNTSVEYYTVSDTQGNEFVLLNTQTFKTKGLQKGIAFKAKELGDINPDYLTQISPITVNLDIASIDVSSFSFFVFNVKTNKSNITLAGLDSNVNSTSESSFAVLDQLGNEYFLVQTTTIATACTKQCVFRAKNNGAMQIAAGNLIMQNAADGVESVK